MRWQVYRLARLIGKVVRFHHRGTHWWAASPYQKQRNRSGLNNWLDCLASWYTPNFNLCILLRIGQPKFQSNGKISEPLQLVNSSECATHGSSSLINLKRKGVFRKWGIIHEFSGSLHAHCCISVARKTEKGTSKKCSRALVTLAKVGILLQNTYADKTGDDWCWIIFTKTISWLSYMWILCY